MRADWKCEACGKVAGRLEVHHVRRVDSFEASDRGPDGPAHRLENLTVRCVPCHRDEHRAQRVALESPGEAAWREKVEELL